MAIIDIREQPQRRLSTGLSGQEFQRELDRTFWIKTDDPADDQVTIETSGLLPAYGDPHPASASSTCVNYQIANAGRGLFLWQASFQYSRQPLQLQEQEKQTVPNPLDRSAHLEIQFAPFERFVVKDKDGKAIKNSANELYRDPIGLPDERIRIVVKKNFTTWPSFLFTFRRSTNSDAITIRGITFPPRSLRFVPGDIPDFAIENGVVHLPVTFVLEHREELWDVELLDAGYCRKGPGPKFLPTPLEIGGERPSVPQLLNGAGQLLVPATTANPIYNRFRVLREIPYAGLPLT